MKIALNFKGKKIVVGDVSECRGIWKYVGLMFSSRENAKILLFRFGKPSRKAIHSIFVFFPFLALWLDSENKVIEAKKVEPFQPIVKPKNKFSRLVEIPLNKQNMEILSIIVDTERFK